MQLGIFFSSYDLTHGFLMRSVNGILILVDQCNNISTLKLSKWGKAFSFTSWVTRAHHICIYTCKFYCYEFVFLLLYLNIAYFYLTEPMFIRCVVLTTYFQRRNYAFHVLRIWLFNITYRGKRGCIGFYSTFHVSSSRFSRSIVKLVRKV